MRYPIIKTRIAIVGLVVGLVMSSSVPSRGEPNCTCRYGGQSYSLASCVCIETANGGRMACCGKVLNNSSWNFTDAVCPIAPAPKGSPPTVETNATIGVAASPAGGTANTHASVRTR